MKRIWNDAKARTFLVNAGVDFSSMKYGTIKGGLHGLKQCSAMDYLHKCGVRFSFVEKV